MNTKHNTPNPRRLLNLATRREGVTLLFSDHGYQGCRFQAYRSAENLRKRRAHRLTNGVKEVVLPFRVVENVERETGIEPATNSLEGRP